MSEFNGVITALATPFQHGDVDLSSFARLLVRQASEGIRGFVINGTTGESPTLRVEEVKKLFEIARSELGNKAKLIVGTGLNSTEKTCEFSELVSKWKPDALLVVVPYYNRPPQRGLFEHFKAVADRSKSPVILYNVPSRTVAALEASTIASLSQHSNIIGIKEASGNMELLAEIKSLVGPDFSLLSGDDLSSVEFVEKGGHGVISVSSHIIGAEMIAFLASAQKGDRKANLQFREKFAELMRHLYIEANPIPLKAALKWMDIFASSELRLPLASLGAKFEKDFRQCLAHLGKL